MATAYRNTFLNWITKTLLQSELGGEFSLPDFFKYEGVPFRLYIVEPDYTVQPEGYSRVDISNLSLRITVNDVLDDATPLAEQATWTKDNNENTFSGELTLNTAGISALFTSAAVTSVTAYFQIQVAESGGDWRTVYQTTVTIKNSVTQPTTTSPDPTKTYRTADESDGIYMTPKGRAGVQIGLVSPDGTKVRWLGVDNNGTRVDDVEDNV